MKKQIKVPSCVESNNGGRTREEVTFDGVAVSLLRQRTGKLDNAVLDFTNTAFNPFVFEKIYELDKYNCYPYVIITDETQLAKKMVTRLDLIRDVIIFDTSVDKKVIQTFMFVSSISKGRSKGMNAKKSHKLDDILMTYVQSIISKITNNVQVFKPNEKKGTINGDLQMNFNGVPFFRQENKNISEVLNITERGSMVSGKALLSTGELDDLFVSFIGFKDSFMDNIMKSSPAHIAKAYIEFSVIDQESIMEGDVTPFEQTHVLYPIDISDISKGVRVGETLREFYENIVIKQIS